jgi:quinol monooxygenase YgiN
MIVVVGTFRLPVEKLPEAREALIRVVEATRAETGCIDYAYAADVLEPGLIRVSEKWDTREALAAHFQTAHMEQWRREREALGLSDRDIRAYEIRGEEIL